MGTELKNNRKKPLIELRYYELPEHEQALALQGYEWVRIYGTESEDLHFHNLMEIGVCLWGEGTLILDEQHLAYASGAVTLIPPNCLHATISRDGTLNEWAYLFIEPKQILSAAYPDDPLFVDSVLRRLNREGRLLPAEQAGELPALIRLVLAEYKTEQTYHAEAVQSLLTSLLLLAARLAPDTEAAVPPISAGLRQIIPAIEYISRCYMNPISVEDLAAQCSLSEAHLRRKFKEYLHMSPLEHLTLVRIRRGCELLNTTNCPVPEVALRVGYQSVSSFSRNFQKIVKTSPYQYKKNRKDYKGKLLEYKIEAKRGWKKIEDD